MEPERLFMKFPHTEHFRFQLTFIYRHNFIIVSCGFHHCHKIRKWQTVVMLHGPLEEPGPHFENHRSEQAHNSCLCVWCFFFKLFYFFPHWYEYQAQQCFWVFKHFVVTVRVKTQSINQKYLTNQSCGQKVILIKS